MKQKNKKILLITSIILLIVLCVSLSFFSIYLGLGILFVLIISFYFLKKYKSKTKEKINEVEEFVNAFTYFRIFINNGLNVYEAIKEMSKYSSSWMVEQTNLLITNIDNDKTVQPFIIYAAEFKNEIISELMITVYQMIDNGVNLEYINSFNYMFDELKKETEILKMKHSEKSISGKIIYSLFGAGIFTLGLMIGVVGILGGTISGI